MLSRTELTRTAAEFGVAEDQVRRDHLISHVLHAVATAEPPVIFFGGTALARTHLAEPAKGGRLSEDIDLHATERRRLAAALDQALPRALRREFPGLVWSPALSGTKHGARKSRDYGRPSRAHSAHRRCGPPRTRTLAVRTQKRDAAL